MIDKGDKLPVTRQCDPLDLSRSFVYYTPVPLSVKDMELLRQSDETGNSHCQSKKGWIGH